tara:strand:- start:497 stop:1408 length:912 start_codon:yes stop_codon:yes gene_type:complete
MAEDQAVEEEYQEEENQEETQEEFQEDELESGDEPSGEEDISTWRDLIQDTKLAKHAERFTDLDALVKANIDSRKQLSKAVVRPGEDADEETWTAYREATGVPQDVDGYEFPLPEGVDRTDQMMDGEDKWSNIFLDNNVPKATADALVSEFRGELEAMQQAKMAADQDFTLRSQEALKQEWAEDYDKNLIFAARASEKAFGKSFEDARFMETSDGNFMLDHPLMVRMFAQLGREMGEGSLGGVATAGERESLNEQAQGFRDKRNAAMAKNLHAEAKRWDQKELAVLEKLHGNAPIVGTSTRNL